MTNGSNTASDRGRSFFGALLLIFFLFLTLSLLSYSPLDPPQSIIYSSQEIKTIHNFCGYPGSFCASVLVNFCGIGAWFLLIPLFFRFVTYWRGKELKDSILKTFGVFMMLIAISGGAAVLVPNLSVGPLTGPGGELGAMILFAFERSFTLVGMIIFLSFFLMAGVILACDWPILRVLLMVTGIWPVAEILMGRRLSEKKPQKKVDEKLKKPLPAKAETASEPQRIQGIEVQANLPETSAKVEEPLSQKADEKTEETPQPQFQETILPPNPQENESKEDISAVFDGEGGKQTADVSETAFTSLEHGKTGESPSVAAALTFDTPRELELQSKSEFISSEPESSESEEEEPQEASVSRRKYQFPPITLLKESEPSENESSNEICWERRKDLEKAFRSYGYEVRVVGMQSGPVVTLYELELAEGLRVAKIIGLANDLALVMSVSNVRIIPNIPGKNRVGVEIPNKDRQLVRLRDVMTEGYDQISRLKIPVFIGKNIAGLPIVSDLTKLPHLLIAGRTGTGKSVCLNTLILSILMTRSPEEVRLIMIDPKWVEFSPYKSIPHLMVPVITEVKKAEMTLSWIVDKMEERYQLLSRAGARQISEYNQMGPERLKERIQPDDESEWARIPRKLPYIVIIADEIGDLMAVAGKDIELYIARLAQKSRAVGIHLVLATQKPTVDVITGLIKSNLPARIAFAVATQSDSRVVLDENGAEQLLGNGDLLFLDPITNHTIRGQGTYVSGEEIDSVIYEIAVEEPDFVKIDFEDEEGNGKTIKKAKSQDPDYSKAVEIVLTEQQASGSYLQRRLGVGYNRGMRMIEAMEAEGIVGPQPKNKSQPREILITLEEWRSRNENPYSDQPEFSSPSLIPSISPEREEFYEDTEDQEPEEWENPQKDSWNEGEDRKNDSPYSQENADDFDDSRVFQKQSEELTSNSFFDEKSERRKNEEGRNEAERNEGRDIRPERFPWREDSTDPQAENQKDADFSQRPARKEESSMAASNNFSKKKKKNRNRQRFSSDEDRRNQKPIPPWEESYGRGRSDDFADEGGEMSEEYDDGEDDWGDWEEEDQGFSSKRHSSDSSVPNLRDLARQRNQGKNKKRHKKKRR